MLTRPDVALAERRRPSPARIARAAETRFVPQNLLRAWVLLLLKERPDHGYGLGERLKDTGIADGNSGAVYRTLRSLEDTGLVESSWTPSAAGPPKRVYVVTPAGDHVLDVWTCSLRETHDALTAYLGRRGAIR